MEIKFNILQTKNAQKLIEELDVVIYELNKIINYLTVIKTSKSGIFTFALIPLILIT